MTRAAKVPKSLDQIAQEFIDADMPAPPPEPDETAPPPEPVPTPDPPLAPVDRVRDRVPDRPDIGQYYDELREFIRRELVDTVDYGTIAMGGNRKSKPSLFKPGAEKIALYLGVTPRFKPDFETRGMAAGQDGLFCYRCLLINKAGRVVGEGRGAARENEKSNWLPNHALKMAMKRAQVDAVLRMAGLSEFFTQDLEDLAPDSGPSAPQVTRPAGGQTTPRRPDGYDHTAPSYVHEDSERTNLLVVLRELVATRKIDQAKLRERMLVKYGVDRFESMTIEQLRDVHAQLTAR